MSDISFDIEGILDDARTKTGFDDFGLNGYHNPKTDDQKTDFHAGLQVLLDTYDTCGYTERGRKRARRRVVDLYSWLNACVLKKVSNVIRKFSKRKSLAQCILPACPVPEHPLYLTC